MIKPDAYRSLASLENSTVLNHKRVFLRADLNIPLAHDGTIQDDFRLQAIVPTLNFLQKQHATVILATHIGRPDGRDEKLSTKQLIPWFEKRGYSVAFAPDIAQAAELSRHKKAPLILLENLRFFPGEKTGDPQFAQQLAQLADYYVTDAFGSLHRQDTSIAQVPYLFAADHRFLGLLVAKELHMLSQLLNKPAHPFVLLIGGGKVADKIPLIMHLLEVVDTILLCPALVFTFLHAQGKLTGASLVDPHTTELCTAVLEHASQKKVKVLFPVDYYISHDAFTNPMEKEPISAAALQDNLVGITIGPKTVAFYQAELKKAQTILINGLMGDVTRPETLIASKQLYTTVAENLTATRIIGGGDSLAAVTICGLRDVIGHLSTGGGSMLALLTGQELIGLQPFLLRKSDKN